ncbi:MAG: virulence RhuM family protein [Prevotellaceae bacterium]|nr:virulence RhuM family protein [Prevotellaceae bacterium]
MKDKDKDKDKDEDKNEIVPEQPDKDKGEIVLYQPNNSLKLEVRLENETVWLNRHQIALLFNRDVKTIGKHINNALKEELQDFSVVAKFATTAADGKSYQMAYYSLDMILSVGYRVKSKQGIVFRQWASPILKDYLLKGYAINQRIERVGKRVEKFSIETDKRLTETEKKIDFFVKTSTPPVEGIFYDGQIFDAYVFASDLIKSAKKSIVLIDNYVDESVLLLLSKRKKRVDATIYTASVSPQFKLDVQKHNAQYPAVTVKVFTRSHDRFLLIDDDVYHIGASLKDLGKKMFAFAKMILEAKTLLQNII